jgi:hypothetical protein
MIPYVCLGIFGENGTLDKYIIFKGDSEIEDKTLFSELEWLSIKDGKQTVISSKQQIFPDDTIHTIKQKILYELERDVAQVVVKDDDVQGGAGETNMSTVSYEELYLFYESYQKKTAYSMYEMVLDSLNRMNRKGFKKRVGMSDNEKNQFLINHGFSLEVSDAGVSGVSDAGVSGVGVSMEELETEEDEPWTYQKWKPYWPYNNIYCTMMALGRRLAGKEDPFFCANPFFLLVNFMQEWKVKNRIPVIPETSDAELLLNFIPSCVGMDVQEDDESKNAKTKRVMLYLATTENSLNYYQRNTENSQIETPDEGLFIAIYYPYLYEKGVRSYAQFAAYREQIQTGKSEKKGMESLMNVQKRLAMFYEMARLSPVIPYKHRGITYFQFLIRSQGNNIIRLPLETIFRNVHASFEVPFIQYNSGLKQELLYRLYSTQMSTNGKRIPFLERLVIRKWARQLRNKKKSQICFAIQTTKNHPWSGELFLKLFSNGEIEIEGRPENAWWASDDLERVLIAMVNPLLEKLNVTIKNSGYLVPALMPWLPKVEDSGEDILESQGFSKLRILNLNYQWNVSVSKPISLEEIRSCASAAFLYLPDWNKGEHPVLTFKRVGNFHSMSSELQIIAHYYEQEYSTLEIIEKMQSEHQKTEAEAIRFHSEYVNEIQTGRINEDYRLPGKGLRKIMNGGANGGANGVVEKQNPGFPVQFRMDKVSNALWVEVEHVIDFAYLNTLHLFVEGLLRIGLKEYFPSDAVSVGKSVEWKKMCASKSSQEWTEANIPHVRVMIDNPISVEVDEELEGVGFEWEDLELETGSMLSHRYLDTDSDVESELPDYLNEEEEGLDDFDDAEEVRVEEVVAPIGAEVAAVGDEDIVEEESEISEEESESSSESSEESEVVEKEDTGLEDSSEENGENDSQLSELEFEDIDKEDSKESSNEKDKQKAGNNISIQLMNILKPILKPKPRRKETAITTAITTGKGGQTQNVQKLWMDRMRTRDPLLFEMYDKKTKEIPRFKTYSSSCQVKVQRQPVILTDEEKQKIDQEYPGSYNQALKYSAEEGKNLWYICPRFWCTKTNTSMTEEDVKQGKCGDGVIPMNANYNPQKGVPNQDTSLIEFNDSNQHRNEKREYVSNTPGFIKHDGVCMPCCFKKTQSSEQTCEKSDLGLRAAYYDYVVSDTKVLAPEKWGFLPPSIQSFMNYSVNLKEVMDGKRIKLMKPMLLRYGVEQIPGQSFLGVMADLYAAIRTQEEGIEKETPSVSELRSILVENISLDDFIQYNHGSLIASFRATNIRQKGLSSYFDKMAVTMITKEQGALAMEPEEVDLSDLKYTKSEFYRRLEPMNEMKKSLLYETVASYENYLAYLRDEESVLDPTYLLDIVSRPNPRLFPKGINLILLSIPDNDVTQNVELICPSSVYQSEIFDSKKLTALVMIRTNIYEPIYLMQRTEKDVNQSIKLFSSERSSLLNGTIRGVMDLIRNATNSQCKPQTSIPTYRFELPIYLSEIVKTVQKMKTYALEGLVWNYHGKIVGVLVGVYPNPSQTKPVMLPCYPTTDSSLSKGHVAHKKNLFMDEEGVATDIDTTLRLLKKIHLESKDLKTVIPCLPKMEVVEEEMIVGFLTETNQFVGIQPPVQASEEGDDVDDANDAAAVASGVGVKKFGKQVRDKNTGLPILYSVDTNRVDKAIAANGKVKRDEVIRNIRLENQFYTVFRSTCRVLLNDYENRGAHEGVVGLIREYKKDNTRYVAVLKKLRDLLVSKMNEFLDFVIFEEDVLDDLYEKYYDSEMTICQGSPDPLHCLVPSATSPVKENSPGILNTITKAIGLTKGGNVNKMEAMLLIPKTNLTSKYDNEKAYYLRLADELLRYPRIQNYLLYPKSYLNIQWSDYKVLSNEMILFHSVLFHETPEMNYYKDLMPLPLNDHVKQIPYEIAKPLKTANYSNLIEKSNPLQQEWRKQMPKASSPKRLDQDMENQEPENENQEPENENETADNINEFRVFYEKCIIKTDSVIGNPTNSYWKRAFPSVCKEVFFANQTNTQTFCCIMNILYKHTNVMYTISLLREKLIECYRPWMVRDENRRKVLKHMKIFNGFLESKEVSQYVKGTKSWELIFWHETYCFTELDFWVLSDAMSMPVILFSSYPLKHLFVGLDVKWLVLSVENGKSKSLKYYFVRPPTLIRNEYPEYQMVQPSLDLRTIKDPKEKEGLSIHEQVVSGLENVEGEYGKNIMKLSDWFTSGL